MAAGGRGGETVTTEPTPKMLETPTPSCRCSLYNLSAPSAPNHPQELSRKLSDLGLDRGGWGRRSRNLRLGDFNLELVPAHLSP